LRRFSWGEKTEKFKPICDECRRGFFQTIKKGRFLAEPICSARRARPAARELIEHFCGVNNCTKRDFEEIQDKAFEIWENRSQYEWKQDFGKYGDFIKK